MEELCNFWCVFQENIVVQLIIGAILGAIFSILTTIFIELIRKPRLEISITENSDHENNYPLRRHLILEVKNKNPIWLLKWVNREPAMHCKGTAMFLDINNKPLIENPISIRWCSLPEPSFGLGTNIIQTPSIYDFIPKIDIYPGESEKLVFTIKFDSESEFYGFNNFSYFSSSFKNPNYRIIANICYVDIEIKSSCKTINKRFIIKNEKGIVGFIIEEFKK